MITSFRNDQVFGNGNGGPAGEKSAKWTRPSQASGKVRTEHGTFQELFMCVFQDLPGPFMSIFHVFPGLFNRVDIKQVRFLYNTEYVTVHNYTK